jgi:hypothetical protein
MAVVLFPAARMIFLLLLAVFGWIDVVRGVTLVTLEITEQVIAPDCFPRSSVYILSGAFLTEVL